MCLDHSYTVLKTIRVKDIKDLRVFLEDPSLNLKILHLVRDPRAVINSRRKLKAPNSDLLRRKCPHADESKDLCEHMARNLQYKVDPPSWLKGIYMLVRFEDVAEDPIKQTQQIYQHVRIKIHQDVLGWLKNNTHGNKGHGTGGPFSRTRDTHKVINARKNISIHYDDLKSDQGTHLSTVLNFITADTNLTALDASEERFRCTVQHSGQMCQIVNRLLADEQQRQVYSKGLPCPTGQNGMDTPLAEGYWWNKTWFSLTCGPRVPLNKANVQHCLHDTNIYLTGDSTKRQWFAAITEDLGLGQPKDHERIFLLQRRDKAANLNLTFIFHPLTAHPQQVSVNLSTVKFEAYSPWAHFSIWQWEAYTDWLKGIRAAILVAKQRFPNLLFVYKSPHPVDKWSVFPARDVVFNEMRALVKDVFKGIEKQVEK
eukprot:XP_011664491.1 PREDICTED: uncharacterized protein LOC105438412 [Strongylocentrotus purpuratus]